MTRRRYRYNEATKELEEITFETPITPRIEIQTGAHYADLRAQDGTPIDSPGKHRAYMKRNNLALTEDMKPDFTRAEKQKAVDLAAGRREAIARTIHHYESGKRR
jgi:hypothetical protein